MSKSVSGITKRNKRSIREIKRARSRDGGERQPLNRNGGSGNNTPDRQPPGQRGEERAATFGLWFVGIIGILFLFFLFSVVFAETTVTVYPKTASITVDDTFVASNDPATDGIPYSVVQTEDTITVTATSSGSEYREERARGTIRIYNNHSTEPIRLVPNTRFQTADGNIYRTQSAVTVPGQSGANPGATTAVVVADEAGAAYNKDTAEFSVPGFAGTSYEGNVYAEVDRAISGGVAGNVPVIASSTRAQLEAQAAEELEEALRTELLADLPAEFVTYDSAQTFSASITGSEDISTTTSRLSVTGQLEAVAFDEAQLSSRLATAYSDDISADANIRIQDLDQFEFSFTDETSADLQNEPTFDFTLSGNSVVVWQYDERALVRDLRGLQKDRLDEVLVNYEGIEEAEVVTRPFWKRTLPAEASEIGVNTVIR